jgi:putative CocE/NonD family hydrolase
MLPVRGPDPLSLTLADGVRLDADLYRPDGPGRFPVLLMRQPYGRRIASTVVLAHPSWYAAQGYLVVVQDVRGRGTSTGRFWVLADEAADGAETLAWAANLPGSDGKVGTYGFSYQGLTQLLALAGAGKTGPKRPDAMAPAMAAWTVRDDWAYEGGAYALSGGLYWAAQMGAEQARLAGDVEAHAALVALAASGPGPGDAPGLPDALRRYACYTHHERWLADDPAYWPTVAPATLLAGDPLDVPCLLVGGYADFMLGGTLAAYRAFAPGPGSPRLLLGPWLHLPWGRRIGSVDFGPEAGSAVDREQLAFFDLHVKGRGQPGPPVRLFDLGVKAWRSFGALPDPAPIAFHLVSTGLAAATTAHGRLAREPGPEAVDRLVHDPWRPAPAMGGHHAGGFVDRAAIDDRADAAVYTTAPFGEPLELVGPVIADLAITADAPSFDVACSLSLVTPDGRAIVLATGFRRVAGPSGRHRVALHATCCTVAAGHALRLSVQAAAWPAFAVNPGTGTRPELAHAAEARGSRSRYGTGTPPPPACCCRCFDDHPSAIRVRRRSGLLLVPQ